MNRPALFLTAVLATFAFGAPPSAADDLSEAEITERFQRQATRGLVIAPETGGRAAEPAEGASLYTELPQDEQVAVNIRFDFDSAALREDQKSRLATFCNVIRASEDQVFLIIGHTDASGSAAYNERLSQLRADEVKRHLVADCAIPAARLQTRGEGMRHPLDDTDPRAPVNRRVEFQLLG